MTSRRTYQDSCGIARALDRVGERWALLTIRELLHGPKRFTDLRAGLPRIGPDVLAQRLRDLEADGVIQRRDLPPPAASRVYELTEWGAELGPALVALGRWGSRAPLPAQSPSLGVDAAVVALETTFDAAAAAALDARLECVLVLDGQEFTVVVHRGQLEVRRGADPGASVRITTDTATLAGVLWHARPLADAVAAGELTVAGNEERARCLTGLFAAPEPITT